MPRETKGKTKEKKEVEVVELKEKKNKKTGLSDFARGIIIGTGATILVSAVVILLILGGTDRNRDKSKTGSIVETFEKYFNADEYALVVIAQESCQFCAMYRPLVEALAEDLGIKFLYVDIQAEGLSQLESNKLFGMIQEQGSVPVSAVVRNGEVIRKWGGFAEGEAILEHLIASGMVASGTKYNVETNIDKINYAKFRELLAGPTMSVVIIETIPCPPCTEARLFLNGIGKTNNIKINQLHVQRMTEEDIEHFVGSFESIGMDPEETYLPLVMLVRNGRVVAYHGGYSKSEQGPITTMLKENNIIK